MQTTAMGKTVVCHIVIVMAVLWSFGNEVGTYLYWCPEHNITVVVSKLLMVCVSCCCVELGMLVAI